MVRKEGIVLLSVGIFLLFISANSNDLVNIIFNAIAQFMLAGIIPGTEFAVSSNLSFLFASTLLLAFIFWLFGFRLKTVKRSKKKQPQRSIIEATRRRLRQLRA